MILPIVVIDVREQAAADPDFACTRATVEAWEARQAPGRLELWARAFAIVPPVASLT